MTLPTQNAVPSSAKNDQLFNAEKIDQVVNSDDLQYTDRFGKKRFTFSGLYDVVQTWLSGLGGNTGASGVGIKQGGNVQEATYFLTPQMSSYDPLTLFGSAMNEIIATAQNMDMSIIDVPPGVYNLDKPITATLTKRLTIRMSAGVKIYVNTPMNCFDININKQKLVIKADGASIWCNWTDATNTACAVKVTDNSLDKSFICEDLKVASLTSTYFNCGIYASCANLSTITKCLLQANQYGIYMESFNGNGAGAHAMGNQIVNCEIYSQDTCIYIKNQGTLGCEGLLFTGCELLSPNIGLCINNGGLTSSSYLPPLWRITFNHFNCYNAIYVKDCARVVIVGNDFQSKHSTTSTANGIIAIGGVQDCSILFNTFTSVSPSGAADTYKRSPIYQFASTLTNAYVKVSLNTFWLDGMTDPVFKFESTTNITTVIARDNVLQSAASYSTGEYINYVNLNDDQTIGNSGAAVGLGRSGDVTLASNVLTINRKPSSGTMFSLSQTTIPASSTINQIVCPSNLVGKQVRIYFNSGAITFGHGVNLLCPDNRTLVMTQPGSIDVYFFNTTQAIITNVGGVGTARHNYLTAAPTSSTGGYHGQKYYDSANKIMYEYFDTEGWLQYPVTKVV